MNQKHKNKNWMVVNIHNDFLLGNQIRFKFVIVNQNNLIRVSKINMKLFVYI